MKFDGMMVGIFEKYMYIYADTQEKNLSTMMTAFISNVKKDGLMSIFSSSQNKDTISEDTIMNLANESHRPHNISLVLPAAGEIFLYYKRCLIQFSKMKNLNCIDLIIKIFKKYLKEFIHNILEPSLPKNIAKSSIEKGVPTEILEIYCCIISTSSYCTDTIDQLEVKICELLGDSNSSEMSFLSIKKLYDSLTTNSINHIVQIVEYACETGYQSRSKINWSNYEDVGDQSHYVSIFADILKEYFCSIRDYLYSFEKYYDIFCFKFISCFLPKYINEIFNSKPIAQSGIEQLLLDTQVFKKFLIYLPSIGLEENNTSVEYH
uniref:Vacuolar protein sorting-associated protein 53 homolog (Trinotate prediction) n=1 Tax=Henneguya salminicola TaxID=69463 RepID=A0A6G3MEQ7_HENSL